MRVARNLMVGGILAGGFYLLLIDTASLPELYALAGVALLAALGFEVSRQEHMSEASIAPRWLARAWRPLAGVPRQVALVTLEAFRQLLRPRAVRGEFRAVPFRGGQADRDEGRRALTEAWGSVAPNMIVIGVDEETELMLVHQLRPEGPRERLDVLDLG